MTTTMTPTKLRTLFGGMILNFLTKHLLKMLEVVTYRLADYFDALTASLHEQNRNTAVVPIDSVQEVAKVVAKLA
jgi:hypothetical protein